MDSCLAKIPQKPAVVAEEDAEHLGDGEDDLAVGDIREELLPHPLAPLLKSLRMAGWAEPAGTAGEHQEVFRMAVRTADASKSTLGIATVQITLDDFFDDGPEETVLFLETSLILGQEMIEVMKQHPVEHGAFGMPRAVNSCHSKRHLSRNGPTSGR